MMDEKNNQTLRAAHMVESASESLGGKLLWKIASMALGIIMAVMLTSIQHTMSQSNQIAMEAQKTNYEQTQDIALLKDRQATIKAISDQQIETLKALTLQVQQLNDFMDSERRSHRK